MEFTFLNIAKGETCAPVTCQKFWGFFCEAFKNLSNFFQMGDVKSIPVFFVGHKTLKVAHFEDNANVLIHSKERYTVTEGKYSFPAISGI